MGERVILITQAAKDAALSLVRLIFMEETQSHVDAGEISKWVVSGEIIFNNRLPKTNVGKLDKKPLWQDISMHLGSKL